MCTLLNSLSNKRTKTQIKNDRKEKKERRERKERFLECGKKKGIILHAVTAIVFCLYINIKSVCDLNQE